MQVINAQIESTTLGLDRGVFLTPWLHLTWDSCGQGFGGHILINAHLAKEQEPKKADSGMDFAARYISGILEAVGVDNWEQLKGKCVRIEKPDGWNSTITGVGHIVENKWFRPAELIAKCGLEKD